MPLTAAQWLYLVKLLDKVPSGVSCDVDFGVKVVKLEALKTLGLEYLREHEEPIIDDEDDVE